MPSRLGPGGQFVPLGPLYAAGACIRAGHEAKIIDLYLPGVSVYFELEKYKPDVVAFGGIASSYGRMKRFSLVIKEQYPEIVQVAGGPLASVDELIMKNTAVNWICHGEGELSLPEELKWIEEGGWKNVKEIQDQPQIEDLDTILIPPYHLIDPIKYIDENHPYFPVMTSRGCTNACSFCYRHMQGYRQHSVHYVMEHLDVLNREYGITKFAFGDELFNYKKEWVMEFCASMFGLGYTYRVEGARVDRMDEEMLTALRECGCVGINYGQESGSDKILKEYRKGTTAETNRRVTMATRAAGIRCPVQIVIGGPGETGETIQETIRFLKDTGTTDPSINYLTPFPGTPVWKYVEEHHLIPDVEKYLDEVARRDASSPIVNLTREPWWKWRFWAWRMKRAVRR